MRSVLLEVPPGRLCGALVACPQGLSRARLLQVADHSRRASRTYCTQGKDESAQSFDEARVPVETIVVANPRFEGLGPNEHEMIG